MLASEDEDEVCKNNENYQYHERHNKILHLQLHKKYKDFVLHVPVCCELISLA